ncbi:hypothetical protein [Lentzea albida]|uniref:hypothetical protein n=1 Tax=Lentzea albida TaxID=65499 RepID=UPI0011601FF1|nr:hypothetical protein [Lentzea albida]
MFSYTGEAQLVDVTGRVFQLPRVVLKETKNGLHSEWGGTGVGGPGINTGLGQIHLSTGVVLEVEVLDAPVNVSSSGVVAQVILGGVGDPPGASA